MKPFACLFLIASLAHAGEWQPLFDGKTLDGWKVTAFFRPGKVEVKNGHILLGAGANLTGIHRNPAPFRSNYELELEAMRISGRDFFCGVTFPVGKDCCSFIVGGWGGNLVGLSSLESLDASANETGKNFPMQSNRWYRIRVRVTTGRIECWIDKEKLVDLATAGRKLNLRPGEIEESAPFGIASYDTTAALRAVRIRSLDGK